MLFLDKIIFRIIEIVFIILLFQNMMRQDVKSIGDLLFGHRVVQEQIFVTLEIGVWKVDEAQEVEVFGGLYLVEGG